MLDFSRLVYELKDKMDKIFGPRDYHTSAPTQAPTNSKEQFILYKNGTTYRLYTFIDGEWYYVDLTKVT